LHVHAENVLASALVCAKPGVATCRPRRLHLMCFVVVAHKFYNLTSVSLFAQAFRSQEVHRKAQHHTFRNSMLATRQLC